MSGDFRERLRQMGQDGRRPTVRSRRAVPARIRDLGEPERGDGVLVMNRSAADFTAPEALRELLAKLRSAARQVAARDDLHDELRLLLREPERALFIDTETTGLGGNMVFMLGAMRIERGDIRVRQVFARDYREEPELLRVWLDLLASADLLVSFNGKSFDMPVLRDRLGLHGFAPPEEPAHMDLLHHARRRWRGVLPDCRLQTLEWKVCGRKRSGDIPGEEIPSAYHHFVRTGEESDMVTVFHHNALDLITLADIALALPTPEIEAA